MTKGNNMVSGTVMSRVKNLRDSPLGKLIKIDFSDGENAELWANIISECMYAQCDIEGNQYRPMDHIVNFRMDNNVICKDNQDVRLNGKSYKQKSTRGWQLCIEWKDKSTS